MDSVVRSLLQVIIAGCGSELQFCVDAKDQLSECDVRVVSMMCWDTFEAQPESYKETVLMQSQRKAGNVMCVYVEAATMHGESM